MIHSPLSMLDLSDLENAIRLATGFVREAVSLL